MRAKGLALSIPFALLGSPLAGALLGKLIADQTGARWPVLAGLLIGLYLGIRETVALIQKISETEKK